MNSASVVYKGAIAEPKLSTGNTATRSMPTGAASAFDSTCVSEPSTSRSRSASPATSAWSMPSASSRSVAEAPCSSPTVASIFSAAPPSTAAAESAESDSPDPAARSPSKPDPTLATSEDASSASFWSPGFRLVSNSSRIVAAPCCASSANRLISARSACTSALPASSLSAALLMVSRMFSKRPMVAFMRAMTLSSACRYSSGTWSRSASSCATMLRHAATCPSRASACPRSAATLSCEPVAAASNSASADADTAAKPCPPSASAWDNPSAACRSASTRLAAEAAPCDAVLPRPSAWCCAASTSWADSPTSDWAAPASDEYSVSTDAIRSTWSPMERTCADRSAMRPPASDSSA